MCLARRIIQCHLRFSLEGNNRFAQPDNGTSPLE